jgi:hypothetical protein
MRLAPVLAAPSLRSHSGAGTGGAVVGGMLSGLPPKA